MLYDRFLDAKKVLRNLARSIGTTLKTYSTEYRYDLSRRFSQSSLLIQSVKHINIIEYCTYHSYLWLTTLVLELKYSLRTKYSKTNESKLSQLHNNTLSAF
jgi:hypothetical protein